MREQRARGEGEEEVGCCCCSTNDEEEEEEERRDWKGTAMRKEEMSEKNKTRDNQKRKRERKSSLDSFLFLCLD